MTKLILVASAGLLLATASSPPPAPGDYPPCTAKRTDRCTQTYERSASSGHYVERPDYAAAPQPRQGTEGELSSVVAAGPPDYPPGDHAAPAAAVQPGVRYAAPAAQPRPAAPAPRHVQLAMRAGERG